MTGDMSAWIVGVVTLLCASAIGASSSENVSAVAQLNAAMGMPESATVSLTLTAMKISQATSLSSKPSHASTRAVAAITKVPFHFVHPKSKQRIAMSPVAIKRFLDSVNRRYLQLKPRGVTLHTLLSQMSKTSRPVYRRLIAFILYYASKKSEFTAYSTWSPCTRRCGSGFKLRVRICLKHYFPSLLGVSKGKCPGKCVQYKRCQRPPCSLGRQWSKWGAWSACARSCGRAYRTRKRTCPQGQGYYAKCVGSFRQVVFCRQPPCSRPGSTWSAWTAWGSCSATCTVQGAGSSSSPTQVRQRTCQPPTTTSAYYRQRVGMPPSQCKGSQNETRSCSEIKPCPVDGSWGEWSPYTPCSVTCGPHGRATRERSCDSPAPRYGGAACSGADKEQRACSASTACAVDGAWSSWSSWSSCSATCGTGGQETRTRTCSNPAASDGGKECEGDDEQQQDCQQTPPACAVDGVWSSWSSWSSCSATCGTGGQETRTRTCSDPAASDGGKECEGDDEQQQDCQQTPPACPVDGVWSSWSSWSSCSATCGTGGQETRTRTCSNPAASNGGKECEGDDEQQQDCQQTPPACPVDGVWSTWSSWSSCSATCGTDGQETRTRTCSNPAASDGGKECEGDDEQQQDCQQTPPACAVDGVWSSWSSWSSCSATCGTDGQETRTRTCSNPAASDGGKECEGDDEQQQDCQQTPPACAVDGAWSSWSSWSSCSATCGTGGQETRTRTCSNPAASNGGKECEGDDEQQQDCQQTPPACAVDGVWSSWSSWSSCSATCGTDGQETRTRTCSNPAASDGGKECEGDDEQQQDCQQTPPACAMNGMWGSWTLWSGCSEACGQGIRNRIRYCSNPPPSDDGEYCDGEFHEEEPCEMRPCPVDGMWASWQQWSACSSTCGDGYRDRYRACANPVPADGGKICKGKSEETMKCNQKNCLIDGAWTTWSSWSECSKTCGGGRETRHRFCTNPTPKFGGKACQGGGEGSRVCADFTCASGPVPDFGT
ncbi:A disintegrin and metalloproteinase with thrombospondin motifs adt-1-like isoform X2 [Sycon ciliatum]|uniref:A disintegrin and metalloproteinase with thrombospondin motifs adt-1-like isoform X2 n=1 Tax=Sycon ciliatum TaxID=27933 RepID=UPI0031F694B7